MCCERPGRGPVLREQDVVVPDEAISRSCFDTHVGGYPGSDQRPNAMRPENQVQVGSMERVVPVLGNDGLVWERLHISEELCLPRIRWAGLADRVALSTETSRRRL